MCVANMVLIYSYVEVISRPAVTGPSSAQEYKQWWHGRVYWSQRPLAPLHRAHQHRDPA